MPLFIDLTGKSFGRWTVIKRGANDKCGARFICKCVCGTVRLVKASTLKDGASYSCGCYHIERVTTHGHTRGRHNKSTQARTRTYITWERLKSRCFNPKDPSYKCYGGRGISVSKRWMSFVNFFKDMGERPKGLTLDRIDNNKGYYKSNCKWSTCKEQCNNRSTNVFIVYKNMKKTLSQWADYIGIPRSKLQKSKNRTQLIEDKLK